MRNASGAEVFTTIVLGIVGEADQVIKEVEEFQSVTTWRWYQGTQATAMTVGSAALGPVGVGTVLLDVGFSYRKMAHTAWGIGHLMGSEVDPLDDLFAVTGLWAGVIGGEMASTMSGTLQVLETAAKPMSALAALAAAFPEVAEAVSAKVLSEAGKRTANRFVPLIGPLVGGALTVHSLHRFGDCAIDYYARKGDSGVRALLPTG
ncbi:hypothetical protein ACFYWX_16035 [Streptomyces sp. NPDC002888]|uniref:hypothetical protein n=1 Tax=Streptomyces sp. NPDC002888 TaxID=3364668 RepID=UPI0036BD4419